MTEQPKKDWNPETYGRFRGLRLRPAMDLLAQVPELPPGPVIDLGCGSGSVAEALRFRFRDRRIVGIDNSPTMLKEAHDTGIYDDLINSDASVWTPDAPPALIFSNALCQWLPDHPALFARLAGMLQPAGTLAVQMPRQFAAPSLALLREISQRMFPDRFDFSRWRAPVAAATDYARMLASLGTADVWETEYVQRLAPARSGHPVRHFSESTAMRPFLEKLDATEAARFIAEYEVALDQHYPVEPDGHVLYPFRRVFFILTRQGR